MRPELAPVRLHRRPARDAGDRDGRVAVGPRGRSCRCTIGDLAWWFAGGGPDVDWAARIRIWTDGGPDRRLGLVQAAGRLDWFVAHGLDEADERRRPARRSSAGRRASAIAGGWHRAGRQPRAGRGLGAPTAGSRPTSCRARLRPDRHGAHAVLPVARRDLPEPVVPEGYARPDGRRPGRDRGPRRGPPGGVRAVEDDRREVRDPRRAGALRVRPRRRSSTRPTARSRRSRCAGWTARPQIGEFEPVGTHPDHQRRGLGKAVNTLRAAAAARRRRARRDGVLRCLQRRLRGALPVRRLPADRDPPGVRRARRGG